MANKIERHYGLGLLSGKVLAYQRVISLIKTELSKTSAEHQDAILHLKALLSDVYSFHADADDVVVHRNDDVAEITFTMPAHDVEVTCTSRSTMGVCGPNNNLFMGIGSSAPLQNTPQAPVSDSKGSTIDTEWICPNCQTKNAGKFCCGCGTPRQ